MDQAQPEDGLFSVIENIDETREEDETTHLLPSRLAGGPWNPSHQHGGAVAGLLTRALHQYASPVPMRLARITVEMFRGAPMTALRIETRLLRAGRRIQSIEPILRLATLADHASGTGNDMDYGKYTSINPDLTIHVLREPRSEWIGIRGLTRRAEDGIGQSHATLYDLDGPIANVSASLLLDKR
jgi:hypothetical protein